MNYQEIEPAIAKAIANRPTFLYGKWHIVWLANTIKLVSTRKNPVPEIVFGIITEYQATFGLTSAEWNALTGRVFAFLTERGML